MCVIVLVVLGAETLKFMMIGRPVVVWTCVILGVILVVLVVGLLATLAMSMQQIKFEAPVIMVGRCSLLAAGAVRWTKPSFVVCVGRYSLVLLLGGRLMMTRLLIFVLIVLVRKWAMLFPCVQTGPQQFTSMTGALLLARWNLCITFSAIAMSLFVVSVCRFVVRTAGLLVTGLAKGTFSLTTLMLVFGSLCSIVTEWLWLGLFVTTQDMNVPWFRVPSVVKWVLTWATCGAFRGRWTGDSVRLPLWCGKFCCWLFVSHVFLFSIQKVVRL